jgi:formate hydrogenlyase subunit 4
MPYDASLSSVVALVVLAVAAPLVPGIAVRTKAVLTGRRGAPAWQLYADLWKLARRGVVYSTTTTWVFRAAPVVLVTTTLAAASLVPLDGRSATLRFAGDAIAFAYLFALGRFGLVLAALDTGSSFEGIGASREVTFASLGEVGLFIALAALGLEAHDFSLTHMLGQANVRATVVVAPASFMLGVSLFALTLAECSRVPVDDPATHLELTMVHEVMVLDHSGPDLALVLYASALKLSVFAALIIGVLPIPHRTSWTGIAWLGGALAGLGMGVGIVESMMARLRLPRVPLFLAGSAALALFGLILQLR